MKGEKPIVKVFRNYNLYQVLLLLIILFLGIKDCYSQKKDSLSPGSLSKSIQPEIFTSGFIDILNSGQVNASARFLRISIGEPGKFSIPISLYSGVTSQGFQGNASIGLRSNDMLVANFINPLSGLVNISFDNLIFFSRRKERITNCGLLYHIGERVLTGIKQGPITGPMTGKPVNFLNAFCSFGFYFQTGAWERGNDKNLGVTWLAFRYIGCFTNPDKLKECMPGIMTNGVYLGYSIGWGVEITRLVNLKVVYYKYTRQPEIEYFQPICQFSFNYSIKSGI